MEERNYIVPFVRKDKNAIFLKTIFFKNLKKEVNLAKEAAANFQCKDVRVTLQ
jgi:hypothetical protein